ncbi:mammalian cell entry protein [Bacteroidia bacterium]|nr:mammalian cell entry protein [Bacteroidia bacterium]
MMVTAIGLLFFGMNFLKGTSLFSVENTYYVYLDNVDGLQKSLPVNIRGFKVGQVADIKYEPQNPHPFTVVLFVSKKMTIPVTAKVEIYEDGLLGGKSVRIVFDAKDLSEISFNSGDTIPSFVTGGLMSNIQNDLLVKISGVATQADSLMRAFRTLAESQHLQESLAALDATTTSLSASSKQLNVMLNNDLPELFSNINGITTDLKQFSGNVSGIDLAKTVDSLNTTVGNLKNLTAKINSNDGTLGALMNDKQLYINLKNVSDNANQLLIDLKENPKRYVHFSVW